MKILKPVLSFVLALFLITSCSSNKKQQNDTSEETYDLQSYIDAAEAITPDLNSVDQIFKVLDMVEAGYYPVLTNDPYSAHSYKSTYPVAAANLGIFMTDMVYHLYGENTETMYLTFAAAQELARHIGVESEFASTTIENLEGTMMKRDTITILFNELMKESEKYNSSQEMLFVHTAFLTGAFIEKVHISSSLLKQKMKAEEISRENESNIKELLVIYLNQIEPTGILLEAFEQQQAQLERVVMGNTFTKLDMLATQLREVKSSLVAMPVNEIATDEALLSSFELISELRTTIVTSSE